ncbi:MAG: S8 family serine peptidase [Calditrichia bacterium]
MKRGLWFFLMAVFLLQVQSATAQLVPGKDYSDRSFWVVFKPYMESIQIQQTEDGPESGIASVDSLFSEAEVNKVVQEAPFADARDRVGDISFQNLYRVEVPPTADILQVINRFSDDPSVVVAEPIPIYYPNEIIPYTPNDALFASQWHLTAIQADYAWGMWNGNAPTTDTVVVAILDTGVDWDHPDLIGSIFVNPAEDIDGDGVVGDFGDPSAGGDEDGIDNDGNGYVDDLIGWDFCGSDKNNPQPDNDPHSSPNVGVFGMLMHGTHVAGTAAPTTNNNIGVAGPGFGAKIMPIKVAYDNDTQSTPGVYASPASYIYAAKSGAHILNCSFGGTGYSGITQSAINLVHDTYGAIVVAAAGNDNVNLNNSHHYPSDYNNVISVAALNSGDTKASFSNYGSSVDISAPGVNIWSTIYKNNGTGYQGAGWSGTSMASPLVAGSLALLKGFFPEKSNIWLEQRIIDAADNIDGVNPAYVGSLGTGRVNIYSAIAQGILPKLAFKSYSLEIQDDTDGQLNPGETALMRVTLENQAGWNTAAGIKAVLRSPGGELQISDSLAVFQDISSGSIGLNLIDRFQFTVDSTASIGDIPVELYITANQDSAVAYDILLSFNIATSINQQGWPQAINGFAESSPAAVDLNGDGSKEVILTAVDNKVYVWQADGTPLSGFPFTAGNQFVASPAVADIDNDGQPEIAAASKDNHLYLLEADGSLLLDFDAGAQLWGTPTLADFDGDGDLEIAFGDFNGRLHLIQHDGTYAANFPLDLTTIHRILGGLAVSDLDNDGNLDIAFGTFNGDVYAVSSATGAPLSGFPVAVGARVNGAPAIADLDGPGPMPQTIIVTSLFKNLNLITADGSVYAEYNFPEAIEGEPAIADLDQDGSADIIFGCNDDRLYAVAADGTPLAGFPVSVGFDIQSSPVVADWETDGSPEIAFINTGGFLYLLESDGLPRTGFPIEMGGLLKSSPTITDLDNDGDLELLAGGSSEMFVYDVPGNATADQQWFTLQGNYQRTGNYQEIFTSIAQPGITQFPQEYRLEPNYPNPFNPVTTIAFQVPQKSTVKLEIFNILGQKIRTLVNDVRDAGRHTVRWDGTNDAGYQMPSGVYIYRMESEDFVQTSKMMLMK